jgi:hypothetical protein
MKSLGRELKEEGLNIAEDAVAKTVKAVFRAVPKALASRVAEGKMNAGVAGLIGGLMPIIEPFVMELVDSIDGENDFGEGSQESAE